MRGDANNDRRADISDAVDALLHLFVGAPTNCEDALDANDDGTLGVADPIFLLAYLFAAGDPLPSPYPETGEDPTEDALGCNR